MTKTLGIIGGMGPMATSFLTEMLITYTRAERDQDHIETISYSRPGIPDRTAFLLGKSREDPLPVLKETALTLRDMGSEVLAVPCVTSVVYREELQRATGIPVLYGINATIGDLRSKGVEKAGLLATEGTLKAGIVKGAFEEQGIEIICPGEQGRSYVMELIYDDIKKGRVPDISKFEKVSEELLDKGAGSLILGCTELSLIKKYTKLSGVYADILEYLAKEAVLACGGELKEDMV